MPRRDEDWLRQAEKDFRHAGNSLKDEDYEWACFSAQQACKKAVKALYFSLGGEGWGHSLTKLLKDLPKEVAPAAEVMEAAMALDKHYIPARYPNGFDAGAPMDYYTESDAKKALDDAAAIFAHVKGKIRK